LPKNRQHAFTPYTTALSKRGKGRKGRERGGIRKNREGKEREGKRERRKGRMRGREERKGRGNGKREK